MKKLFCILLLLMLIAFPAFGATYYVAQSSAGNGLGGDYDNRASVSYHNAGSGNFAALDGDTVYLCDTITSEVTPPDSGSAGNYVHYRGDYAGHAGTIDRNGGDDGFAIRSKDYIIVDGITVTDFSGDGILMSVACDYITVKNCTVTGGATGGGRGIVSRAGSADTHNTYITIGGADGDGNTVSGITGLPRIDVSVQRTEDIIISYNTFKDGTGDGILTEQTTRALIEYNTIYNHSSEDGIDLKRITNDVIIRFNKIYEHNTQTAITVQMQSHDVYIYGNALRDNDYAGIYIITGVDYPTYTAPYNVWVWSNLIYYNEDAGIVVEQSNTVGKVYITNNTFYDNGYNSGSSSHAGIEITQGTTYAVQNNIFMNNNNASYDSQELHVETGQTGSTIYTYNLGYNAAGAATIDWGASGRVGFATQGSNNTVDNPDFTGAGTDINADFTLMSVSPAINTGTDLSSCFGITIQGTVHTICYDDGLDPNNTDWTTTPPTVATLKRDTYGWSRGAYVYIGADTTAPTITFSYPTSDRTCVSDPRNTTIGCTTDETANCRMGTTDEGDYDLMPADSMTNTDSTSHSEVESLACSASYTYYIYCEDPSGNESTKATVSFDVLAGSQPSPSSPGSLSGGGMSGCSM